MIPHKVTILEGPFVPVPDDWGSDRLFTIYRDNFRVFSPFLMDKDDGIFDGRPACHKFELEIETVHEEPDPISGDQGGLSIWGFDVVTMDGYFLVHDDAQLFAYSITLTSQETRDALSAFHSSTRFYCKREL